MDDIVAKLKCNLCNKVAVWLYMPRDNFQYCDVHVKRGCSCNINPDTGVEDVDDQGRYFPCCEYHYNENGFDE